MINGIHAMFYSSDPDATRAFLRDVLKLSANDVGGGWLIFPVNDAELAVHPVEEGGSPAGTHNFSFYCDDVKATMTDLKSRGAKFKGDIQDMGWGLVTELEIPGGCNALLYEKRY